MISLNFKNILILLLVGFAIGLCSTFLFGGCNKIPFFKKETIVKPKEIKKQSENVELKYSERIIELKNKNDQLQKELSVTKTQLAEAKQKVSEKEAKIKKLIVPKGISASELLARTNISPPKDTALATRDSIGGLISEYIQENSVKDSLYEVLIMQMDSTIAIKGSVITAKTSLYSETKNLLYQSIVSQESLQKENKLLQRQFKRHRIKNKLVTAGLMIMTATATKVLLSH